MSSFKDPFEILAEELTLIRSRMDHLQRSSLDKEEAEALNKQLEDSIQRMSQVGLTLQKVIQRDLSKAVVNVRGDAVEAAQSAAREAIEASHAELIRTAKDLSQAAGEARREAWRRFGGFWVWLVSIAATGTLIGALGVFWLQSRADAKAFGQHPGVYCLSAGGEFADQRDGSRYCVFMVSAPTQPPR